MNPVHDECTERFSIGTRNWLICTGVANLPIYKINAYRTLWGFSSFDIPYDEPGPTTSIPQYLKDVEVTLHGHSVSEEGSTPTVKKLYGPGTELLRIYEAAGIPSCQACKDLAQQMNNWGVEGCELRLLEIVEEIFPRAQEWIAENHPWLHAILPNRLEEGAIRLKIHSDVAQAIQVAKDVIRERRKKNLDVYTGAVKTKSCCH